MNRLIPHASGCLLMVLATTFAGAASADNPAYVTLTFSPYNVYQTGFVTCGTGSASCAYPNAGNQDYAEYAAYLADRYGSVSFFSNAGAYTLRGDDVTYCEVSVSCDDGSAPWDIEYGQAGSAPLRDCYAPCQGGYTQDSLNAMIAVTYQ